MADLGDRDDNRRWNVIVADADETSLTCLEKVLEDCNHMVTKCKDADECMAKIREKNGGFDLVIIDVCIPTTDGYELCRLVRKETNIPIILMSSTYSNAEAIKKALDRGACEFLLKPIKVEDVRKIDLNAACNEGHLIRKESSYGEEEQEVSCAPNSSTEKRKGGDSVTGLDQPPPRKKQRVIWTVELHQQFVTAVNNFGLERAVPKKIMEFMGVPGLTRENVASHLQKYRQYHKKQQGDSQQKQEAKPPPPPQQQQHCRSNDAPDDNHLLSSGSTLTHPNAVQEPIIKSEHEGPDWTDVTVQQEQLLQSSLSYDTWSDWRNQIILNSSGQFSETYIHHNPLQPLDEAGFVGSLDQPNEHINGGINLAQHDAYLSDFQYNSTTGLPLVPEIETYEDSVIQMADLQYSYETSNASTDPILYQGGQISANAIADLYPADQYSQATLDYPTLQCPQTAFNSDYYDPALELHQFNQLGLEINQAGEMNQENATQEFGLKDYIP